jgi:succinoglycan biosynthesis protein ExoA
VPHAPQNPRPLVSVVLAIYNEANHVRKCLDSLRSQDTRTFDMEILAVDGGSTDGTNKYLDDLATHDPRVRVLPNPKRRAPFAFNIGIRESRGEYVCIFGSHTIYTQDYVAVCLRELHTHSAGGCGGRVLTEPATGKLQARLVATAMAHPFGSSGKSFRTQPEGFAKDANYILTRKSALLEVGGYSELLLRNQDNDLNQKLTAAGHRLYCTWQTHCIYHPKETIRELFRYAYQNGFWNVISFRQNPSSMAIHHFVPFVFVLALLISLPVSLVGAFSPHAPLRVMALALPVLLVLHLTVGTFAALQILTKNRFLGAIFLPFVFIGFHISYGLGSLISFLTGATVPKSSPSVVAQPS